MASVPLSNIIEHLAQSIGLEAAESTVKEVLAKLSIPRKDNYETADYNKITASLKEKGGVIASIVDIATADNYLQVVAHSEREKTFRDAYNIVRKSPVILISWKNNLFLTIEFITANVENLLGYTSEEVINMQNSYLDYVDEATKTSVIALFESLKRGTTSKTVNLEHAIKTKSGATKWVDCRVFSKLDKEGNVTQFQGILLDITERVESEKKIQELNELRHTSLKVLSHQMRTPLTVANFGIQTLLTKEEAGEQKELALSISKSTSRAITILDDILIALDVIEGTFVWKKDLVDMSTVIKPIIDAFADKTIEKKLHFTYLAPESQLGMCEVDAKKVSYALEKILDNALIFTREGGSIEAGLNQPEAGWVSFWVKDTGIGIPEKEQSRVFNSFFRASNAFKLFQNASGVSLFIAKAYLEGQGCQIGFESKEDLGSTFWIRLPVKA